MDEFNSNGTYYNPPMSSNTDAPGNEGEYHYSYNQGYNGYTPETPNNNEPPKKSKAGKIAITVLVICLILAVVGLVFSSIDKNNGSNNPEKDNTTQSQKDDSATELSDSESVPLKDKDNNYTVAGVAKECMDSCIGITVYSSQYNAYNNFYSYGYGNSSGNSDTPMQSGEGSGILFKEKDGKTYIITCAHVISGADKFSVTLNDGATCDAYMVGYDSQTDIGVLSIDKTGLKLADFANSDNIVVGEQVVAIGCPGGLEFMNSVTSGYISALARPISSTIGYNTECIQTDAAINPGNSGGALFNMQGQVIGVNSSKIASTNYEGMGFAVPTKTAVATADSLIKVGYVEGRAKLGISYNPLTSFNNSGAILNALAEKGYKDAEGTMVIAEIESTSDLYNKGLKQYDMIVAINGKTMTSIDVLTSVLSKSKPGDTVKLTIARIEGNSITTKEIDCKLIESKK